MDIREYIKNDINGSTTLVKEDLILEVKTDNPDWVKWLLDVTSADVSGNTVTISIDATAVNNADAGENFLFNVRRQMPQAFNSDTFDISGFKRNEKNKNGEKITGVSPAPLFNQILVRYNDKNKNLLPLLYDEKVIHSLINNTQSANKGGSTYLYLACSVIKSAHFGNDNNCKEYIKNILQSLSNTDIVKRWVKEPNMKNSEEFCGYFDYSQPNEIHKKLKSLCELVKNQDSVGNKEEEKFFCTLLLQLFKRYVKNKDDNGDVPELINQMNKQEQDNGKKFIENFMPLYSYMIEKGIASVNTKPLKDNRIDIAPKKLLNEALNQYEIPKYEYTFKIEREVDNVDEKGNITIKDAAETYEPEKTYPDNIDNHLTYFLSAASYACGQKYTSKAGLREEIACYDAIISGKFEKIEGIDNTKKVELVGTKHQDSPYINEKSQKVFVDLITNHNFTKNDIDKLEKVFLYIGGARRKSKNDVLVGGEIGISVKGKMGCVCQDTVKSIFLILCNAGEDPGFLFEKLYPLILKGDKGEEELKKLTIGDVFKRHSKELKTIIANTITGGNYISEDKDKPKYLVVFPKGVDGRTLNIYDIKKLDYRNIRINNILNHKFLTTRASKNSEKDFFQRYKLYICGSNVNLGKTIRTIDLTDSEIECTKDIPSSEQNLTIEEGKFSKYEPELQKLLEQYEAENSKVNRNSIYYIR